MPVIVDRLGPVGPAADFPTRQPGLEIGLVNNMPDSALEATERQFIELLEAASQDVAVHLRLFTLSEIKRYDRAAQRVKQFYAPADVLPRATLDALIVTGTEPIASDLREEPYWRALTKVIDWADANTVSTIFSCLAAHAAVLHGDGIARRPLPKKRFGIYREEAGADHALIAGMEAIPVPHSRWNELREKDLIQAGYDILTHAPDAGVGLFAKQRDSLFLFFQGHPEYDAETLLREYRRDIGRYLRGERPTYPQRPAHYFNSRGGDKITHFKHRAVSARDRGLLDEFPIFELRRTVRNLWRPSAVAIYRNWLSFLGDGKPERMAARPLPARRAANA